MTNEQTRPLPPIGSIWSYRKHPERLYEVVHLANVAHRHSNHPSAVIYRSLNHPSHVFTRTLDAFDTEFARTQTPAPRPSPLHYQERCANALRSILAAGKPDLNQMQYELILEEGRSALAAFDNACSGWSAERFFCGDPHWIHISGPNGVECDIHPEDDFRYADASRVLLALGQALLTEDTPPTASIARPVEDVAHTVVRLDYQPTDGNEAYDAQFDGTYVLYCVCPAHTRIEAVASTDHLQLDYADERCTIFSVHAI